VSGRFRDNRASGKLTGHHREIRFDSDASLMAPLITSMASSNENWTDRQVIVTGGTGFIGSVLVWELNRRGCSDIVIADFPERSEKRGNLTGLHYAEILEPAELHARLASGSLGKIDYIFHLGACSSTTETNEKYLRENNYEYSRNLAEWALGAGVRYVYASSAATYGDGCAGMDDSDPSQLERLQPMNLYGQSKHWMDLHAWRQGWLDRIVGLKYFNVFGPNENHKGDMRSVICKSYAQALENGAIQLFKSYRPEYRDGEPQRDFLYVKDAVAMTLHLAANPSSNGIFNIGSGRLTPGMNWLAPCSQRSSVSRASNTSRCRNRSATNISTPRKRISGNCSPPATRNPLLLLKMRCGITWFTT
jgi:ADP-L-glycero-D-manno-heptose 6-epimerase